MTAASSSSSKPPLIEVSDLGVCFNLHKKKRSVKESLLRGAWRREAPLLWALRGVSFACREGQSLGVVGPNGAGKSTLCLILARILAPDEGKVTVRASHKASRVIRLAGLDNLCTIEEV